MDVIDWTVIIGSFYLAGGAMMLMHELESSAFARLAHAIAVNRHPWIMLFILVAWPVVFVAEFITQIRTYDWRRVRMPLLINLAVFLGVLLWAVLFYLIAERLVEQPGMRAAVTMGLTVLSAGAAGTLLTR